jgi:UPF0716 protein FxsA
VLNVGKWIAIGVLALPPIEILAFVLVAAAIGLAGALILMIATTVAGVMVLRQAGRRHITRLRTAVAQGEAIGTVAQGSGVARVAAGILLVIPGFVTDALGALLLVPAFRRWLGATFRHAVMGGRKRASTGEPAVIDLAPGEWQRLGDRKLRKPRAPRPKQNQTPNQGDEAG